MRLFQIAQNVPQALESVAHTALHRVGGDADDLGDLLECQPLKLAQQKHLALLVGEALHSVGDPLSHQAADRELLGRRTGVVRALGDR